MNTEPLEFLPEARSEGIVCKEIEGELLLYDRTRDKAHCLNESAAAIWKRCDGRTTVAEIANQLANNWGSTPTPGSLSGQRGAGGVGQERVIAERVVWLAMDQLRRAHLLEKTAHWSQTTLGMSRREAVRRIGLGVAIALPIVITITAPTPAQAGSCKHANATCATPADCCSGSCDTVTTHKCLGG